MSILERIKKNGFRFSREFLITDIIKLFKRKQKWRYEKQTSFDRGFTLVNHVITNGENKLYVNGWYDWEIQNKCKELNNQEN